MRLIDADSLDTVPWEEKADAVKAIRNAPTIDAVPVVRCKDCKHWSVDCGTDETVCLKIYSDGAASAYAWQERKPDDFCSYGERRENKC